MPVTATFFIGSRLIGTITWSGSQRHPSYDGRSIAYFCNTCGEIWQRIYVEPHTVWTTLQMGCRKHPIRNQFGINPGGVFFFPWLETDYGAIPKEVWESDFLFLMELHDQGVIRQAVTFRNRPASIFGGFMNGPRINDTTVAEKVQSCLDTLGALLELIEDNDDVEFPGLDVKVANLEISINDLESEVKAAIKE